MNPRLSICTTGELGKGFELPEEKRVKNDMPEHQPVVFTEPPADIGELFTLTRHGHEVESPMQSSRFSAVRQKGKIQPVSSTQTICFLR